jgi:hypothetical protein
MLPTVRQLAVRLEGKAALLHQFPLCADKRGKRGGGGRRRVFQTFRGYTPPTRNGTVLRARFFFFFFSLFFFFFQSLFPSPPGFHPPSYSLPFPLFFSSPSYPSYSGLELLEYKGGIVFGSYILFFCILTISLSLTLVPRDRPIGYIVTLTLV